MKPAAALLALVVVVTGCYSAVTINLGVNREAASIGKPLAPEVDCEALAQSAKKLDKLQISALNTCNPTPAPAPADDAKAKR
jgi:hypothetical protein